MPARKLLSGTRVLDLTHVIAGPYATYLLALLGARVVRVEPTGGDTLRHRSGSDADLRAAGMGTGFQAQGGEKVSVCLDLKSEEGHRALLDLVAEAHVLVENFRPGVLEGLGLDASTLSARRPNLIHCSLTGYAPKDRRYAWPAYDNVIQAASGLMAVSGSRETGPMKCGAPVVDYASGMMMAFAISSALYARERGATGLQRLEISMQETAQAIMGSLAADFLATGRTPARRGNAAGSGMPASGCFETASGTLAIGANEPHQVAALLRVIGQSELLEDPRFATDDTRREHAGAFGRAVETALAERDADTWESRLNAAGVPAARVREFAEAIAETEEGSPFFAGDPGLPTAPFRIDGFAPRLSRRPGPAGADTRSLASQTSIWGDSP